MKKFLINIALFFAIVAVVDFTLGKVFHYLQAYAGGRTGAEYYVCEKACEDIIIMGSSRASHHYVPEIISEKLDMSCFNAGQDGNGIIMQYGRWKMMIERYSPKLLIYDINVVFDIQENDNMTYIDRLKPFCVDCRVRDYVSTLFPAEKIKLLSSMYQYNYKFLEMTSDFVYSEDFLRTYGYLPLQGQIRDEIVNREMPKKTRSINNDKYKLFYLGQILKEAKEMGTRVVLVVSPSWKGGFFSTDVFDVVKDLAREYDAQYIEYLDSELCESPSLFKDSAHLNDTGARMFTEDFLSRLCI